jgi:rod shape-determining protein MreC
MLFVWFTLAALILLLTPQKITGRLQFAFVRFFHWPLRISRTLSLSAQTQKNRRQIKETEDYNDLKIHIKNLEAQLEQARQNIKQLTKYRHRLPLEGAGIPLAGIISLSIDHANGKMIINRGTDDGINTGQFVIANNSIIGHVTEVASRIAKVTLTTDPAFEKPIIISDLNVKTTKLIGKGNNRAKIKQLGTEYKIKKGDFIVAQLPELDIPMVIGKIKEFQIDRQEPLFWDVTVEPACSIEHLQSVNVIIPNPE